MRTALVILRKDMRRFWWEGMVTTGTLAYLAWIDSTRSDFIPGAMEGALSLLVPAAWAYLIAVVVQDEALVGDRQFWVTRPYPKLSLLCAKAVFVLLFVHLPYLLACSFVLVRREFDPLAYIPQLAWKQLVVASVVTVPGLALAAVTRNLPQFIGAAVLSAGSAFFLVRSVWPEWMPWMPEEPLRGGAALAVVAIGALVIVGLQYLRVSAVLARIVAATTALAAGLTFLCIPADLLADSGTISSGKRLSFKIKNPHPTQRRDMGPAEYFDFPAAPEGLLPGETVEGRSLTVSLPNGERITAKARTFNKPRRADELAGGLGASEGRAGLRLIVGKSALPKLQSGPVSASGTAIARVFRETVITVLVPGTPPTVAGHFRCSRNTGADPYGRGTLLTAICETPVESPRSLHAKLKAGGESWDHRLGDSMPEVPYFWNTWLSPLNRGQTFFQVVADRPAQPGSRWLVPQESLSSAVIELTREVEVQRQKVEYRFDGLDLR